MEMINGSDRKICMITTRHRDEELVWNATAYDHPTLIEPEGIFRDINGFWASLAERHQDDIWNVFVEIHDAMNSIAEIKRLRQRLIPLVKKLYDLHPYQFAENWIVVKSKMVYPSTLLEDYTPFHPRELTYLRKDYQELAVLALLLRPMVPIWGMFLRIVKTITNRHKERLAVILLSQSNIIETAPYKMLRDHVDRLKDKHLINNPVPLSAKADAVGTENIGEVIFCLVVVRRVALGEISQKDTAVNIVSNIYKHVRAQFDGLDKSSGGRIGEKHKPRDDNAEDNVSRAESYKAKTEVTPGSIATIQVFTEDLQRLALIVEPTLDLDILKICHKAAVRTRAEGLYQCSPHQLLFTQYILSKVISPRAVEYPDLDEMFNNMVVTQTVLWHWGLPQLAALMFVTAYELDETQKIHQRRMSSVSKENRDALHKYYPYYQFTGGETRGRNDCVALKVIGNITAMLATAAWVPNAPIELIRDAASVVPSAQALAYNADDEIIVPAEFSDVLARFFIRLNER